jgi:soluble lytic murein transglycosylase
MYTFKSIIIVSLLMFSSANWGLALDQQRIAFLQAEKHIAAGQENRFKAVLSDLQDYPLFDYLNYSWLKKNLEKSKEIQAFLKQYAKTPYAGFLRKKWLRYLAKQQQWSTFKKHYKQQSLSQDLQCYFYWAQYKTGHYQKAMQGAKKLWMVGYSQPKACDPLFAVLAKSQYLEKPKIWQRFKLALKKNNAGLANYLKKSLPNTQRKLAKLWLKVHRKPILIADADNWAVSDLHLNAIFAHGIQRLISNDPLNALEIWDKRSKTIGLSKKDRQGIEARLALALAYRKNHSAHQRLKNLDVLDENVRLWSVRAALSKQDWKGVNESLAKLTGKEKNEERWQYWQARTFSQLGKKELALSLYRDLAKIRSYYGFLAANYLQLNLHLQNHPIQIPPDQLQALMARQDFKAVTEFCFFERDIEAKRQWWHAVKKLDKQQVLTAAKIAEQQGWNTLAIFTVAKVKHWDDVNLRFPFAYSKQVKKNAKLQGLDPAIVFGLIRRESAFDKDAYSPVGARGLMQIMPRTGRQIARKLKEKWRTSSVLFNPDTNLKYGTFYYKQLLTRFDGHYALAAAAYNAGPHRVKHWLPSEKSLPADIWIETIPFKETREYVAAVLAYTMIYQHRLGGNAFEISDLMLDVDPG